MADLTEFQRGVVEAVAARGDAPSTFLQLTEDGPAIHMQGGQSDRKDKLAHVDMLATYVAHLEAETGESREDILESARSRLDA